MKGLVFTYLLTYGGAFTSLFNPFVGLLIYVCFAILRPEHLWSYSVPAGNYSRIVAIGLLLGWAGKGFGRHCPPEFWAFGRASGIVYSLILFLLWAVFSANFIAANTDLAWKWVEVLAKIVIPFLAGITLIDSMDRLKQLAWVILASQGYLALEFNLWYLSGYNRLWHDGFGGMDNNCNAIALVTSLGLGLILGIGAEKWWQKALAFLAVALMVHAVLFSFSRGGMVALIVTGGVTFYLIPKRAVHYLGAIIVIALVIRLAGPEVMARFSTVFAEKQERDSIAESRLILWRACIDTMEREPLGIGAGNWGEVVERYGYQRGKLAHTLWLQVGAELGLPGLAFLVLFYGLCVVRLWPIARSRSPVPDPSYRQMARMVIASLIGFAVSAQFVSLDLLEHPYYVALIGAGTVKLLSTENPEEMSEDDDYGGDA